MWADIRTAIWLRTRHFAFGRTNFILLLIGWAVYVAFAAWAADYARDRGGLLPPVVLSYLTLAWLLWALLPAFGGGGEMDQSRYLDVYPMRKTFLVASGITAIVLDIQYQLIVPWLLAALYGTWGFAALPLAVLFIVSAGALGQVCVWLVTAHPSRQWLTMSALAVVLVVVAVAVHAQPYWGPAGWLVAALDTNGQGYRWWYVAALWVPIGVFAATISYLSGATLKSRGERAASRTTITGFSVIPVVLQAHLYGIWRSNTAKVTLFSCVIIPIVIRTALPDSSVFTVLTFVLIAGGATLATNSYAYDHTGTLALLAWPKARAVLLSAKVTAVMVWLLLLCIPATAMSLAVGFELNANGGVGVFLLGTVLLAAAVTVAGLGTSVRRPCEADHDTLRVRPAPVPSVLGYGLRVIVFLSLLAAMRDPRNPPGVTILCVALLIVAAVLIVARAYRAFCDSAQLCAAFKV